MAALIVGGTGTAVALSTTLLSQQKQFHALDSALDDPHRVGPLVEVIADVDVGVIAWRSNRGLCVDIAVPGNSETGCGFPLVGTPADTTAEARPPTLRRVTILSASGLLGHGEIAVAGIVSAGVDKVELTLTGDQTLAATLTEPSGLLRLPVRFFLFRIPEGQQILQYRAYGAQGRLLEIDQGPPQPG